MHLHQATELRDGWVWPTDDRRCWRATMRHIHMPHDIMQHCTHKRVVVQAGGNCGVYAQLYAQQFDAVYTFEPETVNFYCLTQNTMHDHNVHKIQSFLGRGTEHTQSMLNPADQQSEANSGMFTRDDQPGVIPVLAIDQLGLTQCDLIHLDVEGGEPEALKGAEHTICTHQPMICVEWFQHRDTLTALLTEWGYHSIGLASGTDMMWVHG